MWETWVRSLGWEISQEAGKVVWYSSLLKRIPQFVVIHKVKGFSAVNAVEVDVFWNHDLVEDN